MYGESRRENSLLQDLAKRIFFASDEKHLGFPSLFTCPLSLKPRVPFPQRRRQSYPRGRVGWRPSPPPLAEQSQGRVRPPRPPPFPLRAAEAGRESTKLPPPASGWSSPSRAAFGSGSGRRSGRRVPSRRGKDRLTAFALPALKLNSRALCLDMSWKNLDLVPPLSTC